MKNIPQKVAFVTFGLAPYRIPTFNLLGDSREFDFRVFSVTDRDNIGGMDFGIPENLRFQYRICKRKLIQNRNEKSTLSPDLFYQLWRWKPDAVISPEFGALALICVSYAKLYKIPLIWFGDVAFEGGYGTSIHVHLHRRYSVTKMMDAYCVYGKSSEYYLRSLNAPPEAIFWAPIAPDPNQFSQKSDEEKGKIKAKFGLNKFTFVYSGQIIERKGLLELFDAWVNMPQDFHNQAELIVIGSGPLEKKLKEIIAENEIKNVKMIPAVKASELTDYYNASDIYILPSRNDMWGAVVNEAMMCGMPVLCSINAGARELIIEGENGLTFDPYEPEDIKRAFFWALENRNQFKKIGELCKKIISRYSPEQAAKGIESAVRFAIEKRKLKK